MPNHCNELSSSQPFPWAARLWKFAGSLCRSELFRSSRLRLQTWRRALVLWRGQGLLGSTTFSPLVGIRKLMQPWLFERAPTSWCSPKRLFSIPFISTGQGTHEIYGYRSLRSLCCADLLDDGGCLDRYHPATADCQPLR